MLANGIQAHRICAFQNALRLDERHYVVPYLKIFGVSYSTLTKKLLLLFQSKLFTIKLVDKITPAEAAS